MSQTQMISVKTKAQAAAKHKKGSRQKTSKPKGKKKAKRKPAISIELDKGEYKVSDSKHAMNDDFVSKLLMTKQKLKRFRTLQKQKSGLYHVDDDGKERENVIW